MKVITLIRDYNFVITKDRYYINGIYFNRMGISIYYNILCNSHESMKYYDILKTKDLE
jgi:hypothetical protein